MLYDIFQLHFQQEITLWKACARPSFHPVYTHMDMNIINPAHAMKEYWGKEIQLHSFLTSELDEGEWSASCSLGKTTPVPTD